MEMYRVVLKSATAFFRNDVTSTSYQETFNCPPLSAIHGLIAASCGKYCYDIDIGYIFQYGFKCVDYELILRKEGKHKDLYKIYKTDNRFDRNDILRGCLGTIPVKREILFDCTLKLYLSDREVAESFIHPFYSLLLGRTDDLAMVVQKPEKVDLIDSPNNIQFGGTIIPLNEIRMLPGRLFKLNIKISEEYPRKVEKSGIFTIVEKMNTLQNPPLSIKYDPDIKCGIYIHKGIQDV